MTDSALLELFHNGARERAFNLLMEKYQQKLYWHIRRIVNNHDHTSDVLQNTFIKAWQGLDNFRAESQLFSWLYRIATNESINFLNKEKKHSSISFEGGFGLDNDEDGNSSAPQNYVQSSGADIDGDKIQAKLEKAIAALPEKQRIVFNLRYYDEMPYEQMSEVLQTSVGALKASYFHAAQKIEAALLREE